MRMYDLNISLTDNDEILLLQDAAFEEDQRILISKDQGELVARKILELCSERRLVNGEVPQN